MARRGRGEGSIYKRADGTWAAILDLGWHNGRRQRRFVYGKTRAAVASRLVEMLRARQQGIPLGRERLTLGQFASKWIEGARGTLRLNTALRYEGLIRRHLVPRLGRVRLAKLAPSDLTACYAGMVAEGLAPRTAGHLHRLIGRLLRDAEIEGAIGRNPARLVRPPRVPHQEVRALTAAEARTLLTAAASDRLEALYALALSTGAREGELLALRWADIDLDAGVVSIRRTLLRTPNGLVFAEPKSATSRRPVPIGGSTVESLRSHRRRQAAEQIAAGPSWQGESGDRGLVFTNTLGGPINAGELLRASFYPLLTRAGLPRVRFHDLRHTAATLMLQQGVHPKIVAERLGHSTPMLTLSVYSHVTPTMQRAAADALDTVLSGAVG